MYESVLPKYFALKFNRFHKTPHVVEWALAVRVARKNLVCAASRGNCWWLSQVRCGSLWSDGLLYGGC